MQRTVALQRTGMLRCNVGPKSNQLTALGNSIGGFVAEGSRGVVAALAASTHACHSEANGKRSSNHVGRRHRRILHKKIRLRVDLVDQLNFEFSRNKNSMGVFTIRLRRVYQD
jgi:hypothetical protein